MKISGEERARPKTNNDINPANKLPTITALPTSAITSAIAHAGMTSPKIIPRESAPLCFKYFARFMSVLKTG